MITCREFVDFLMAFLGGELPEREAAAFRRHIDACPPCIHYLDTYRETLVLEKQAYAEEEELFQEAPDNLVRAILASRGTDG